MNILIGLGKLSTAVLWCAVAANLIDPFARPFAGLFNLAGALLLVLHVAILLLGGVSPRSLAARAQVLLFGAFHLWSQPLPAAAVGQPEVAHG